MKSKSIILGGMLLLGMGSVTSCSDMLETDSELVTYEPTLSEASDSVYAVLGIVNKIQQVADRHILLGEVLGDMVTPSARTSTDLAELANFTAGSSNAYNQPADYYAIINNCNYYLYKVDSLLLDQQKLPLFRKEIVAVKGFRAWAYMQLLQIYGTPDNGIPFYTDPILKETDAEVSKYPRYTKDELCTFLIGDLTGYEDYDLPDYNMSISGYSFREFFIPVRVLLADLYLLRGRDTNDYRMAALTYRKFLVNTFTNGNKNFSYPNTNSGYYYWTSKDWRSVSGVTSLGTSASYAYIPMDSITVASGISSDLQNIFNSTEDNLYYPKLEVSTACRNLYSSQSYCYAYKRATSEPDYTITYAPKTFTDDMYRNMVGDLRFSVWYNEGTNRQYSTGSKYSKSTYSLNQISFTVGMSSGRHIPYGKYDYLWLKMAEAINRMGCPETAFAVLKYGLYDELFHDSTAVSNAERAKLVSMSDSLLVQWMDGTEPQVGYSSRGSSEHARSISSGIIGFHSLGSGNADLDSTYQIGARYDELTETWKYDACATLQDSIEYVEDKILEEMGLACAIEGHRFFDLKRIAIRRNDPMILAKKVANRGASEDATLLNFLSDWNNWRLKFPE